MQQARLLVVGVEHLPQEFMVFRERSIHPRGRDPELDAQLDESEDEVDRGEEPEFLFARRSEHRESVAGKRLNVETSERLNVKWLLF